MKRLFQRAHAQVGAAFLVAALPLLLASGSTLLSAQAPAPLPTVVPGVPGEIPDISVIPQVPWQQVVGAFGFFAIVLGWSVVKAVQKWLEKIGRNVPRDPQRIGDQIVAVSKQINALQEHLLDLERRHSRLCGYVNAPIEIETDSRGGEV